jgi:hypothetical protein
MNFGEEVEGFAKMANMNVTQVRQAVALKLFSAVILSTPVLTGRLRGNWVTTLNFDTEETVTTDDPSGSVSIAFAKEVISNAKGDDTIILTNNLPYASVIEFDGWSHTKAPQGMLRINVARFERLLEEQLRKVS